MTHDGEGMQLKGLPLNLLLERVPAAGEWQAEDDPTETSTQTVAKGSLTTLYPGTVRPGLAGSRSPLCQGRKIVIMQARGRPMMEIETTARRPVEFLLAGALQGLAG